MATLTIKNVPDDLYNDLKNQAILHRRSINSEVIASLELVLGTHKPNKQLILSEARRLRKKTERYRLTEKKLKEIKNQGRS